MLIEIIQEEISANDDYKIFIDGVQTHHVYSELLKFSATMHLFKEAVPKARFSIAKKFAWFKLKYGLTRFDNNYYEVVTQSIMRPHYKCQYGADEYDIYGHLGRKYSIFKNDTQVAWWDKEEISNFKGDKNMITAEDEGDDELLIAFCLCIDNYSKVRSNNNNNVTINLGNVGWEVRKFDDKWLPNQKK